MATCMWRRELEVKHISYEVLGAFARVVQIARWRRQVLMFFLPTHRKFSRELASWWTTTLSNTACQVSNPFLSVQKAPLFLGDDQRIACRWPRRKEPWAARTATTYMLTWLRPVVAGRVDIGGTVTAKNIIIATGSVPFVPPGIPIDGKTVRLSTCPILSRHLQLIVMCSTAPCSAKPAAVLCGQCPACCGVAFGCFTDLAQRGDLEHLYQGALFER